MGRRLRGLTICELLFIVAGVIVAATLLLYILYPRNNRAARTASCLCNLKQIATSLMIYEVNHNVTPLAGANPDYTTNESTLDPFICLWRANLLDNSKLFTCPVRKVNIPISDETPGSVSWLASRPDGPQRWDGKTRASNYSFTRVYVRQSPGNRVIAGDSAALDGAYSPNHGDTALETATHGANALHKDGSVRATTPQYTLPSYRSDAKAYDENPPNYWGDSGIEISGTGTEATATGSRIGQMPHPPEESIWQRWDW